MLRGIKAGQESMHPVRKVARGNVTARKHVTDAAAFVHHLMQAEAAVGAREVIVPGLRMMPAVGAQRVGLCRRAGRTVDARDDGFEV